MGRLTILLGIVLVTLIAECTCRGITRGPLNIIRRPIILPTHRLTDLPKRRGRPNLRTVREVREQEPQRLYQDKNINRAPSAGDHPVLPPIIDDVKLDPNRRTARSVDSPRGGSSRGSGGGKETGATHPGYNRRNARAAMIDYPMYDPLSRRIPRPRPHFPGPRVPWPDRNPIYARTVRDVSNVELESSERVARSVDSPSAKRGGGSSRGSGNSRDTGATHPGYNRRNTREARRKFTFNPHIPTMPLRPRPRPPGPTRVPLPKIRPFPAHPRSTRDVSIADVVRKPTHRDVIIPNWNPHARVNPWQRIGGNGRRPRSAEEFDEFSDEEMGAVEHFE